MFKHINSGNSSSGGIGFCGALAVLFIGLKLSNVISWSWGWVISPLWLPLTVIIAVSVILSGVLSLIKRIHKLASKVRIFKNKK